MAYVTGDNILPELPKTISRDVALPHLDSINEDVNPKLLDLNYLDKDAEPPSVVSANAYIGARGIVTALRHGADIVICGRVSDASPVIAAAWYWWNWSESSYDELAGSLIAGHLIECSAYVTGGNFSGFDRHAQDVFVEPGFPIAEIAENGSCIITKHEGTGGLVDVDTVRCQLLYELQGSVYLHSDCQAVLDGVVVEEVGKDR